MMQEKWKERCIYCGGDVYYQSSRQLVKCEWCGHTLATAGFENELARMKAAVEEGEQAKRDLAAAEAAEQEARQRLNQVLSNFVEIGSSQKSEEELVQGISASQKREEELIREIRDAFAEDSAVQSAMMDLLSAIRSEAGEGRDVIGEVLGSLMQGQQSADLRLAMLQELSGKMLHAQQDFGAQLSLQSEIYARLQAAGVDIQKSQQLLQQLMVWFQSASGEEQERLKQISSSSETLLRGQQEIAGKVDDLRAAADRTQKVIEDFQGQYTQDKLEEMRGLFHQAENFQLDREYDKAADYYRQVISKGGRDTEVCWRLLLCHYCITYRQNDAGESVPTILYPDLTAPDELSVRRELASAMADCPHRQMYDVELRKIDTILDEYRLAQQEAAYDFDVFLSVKQEKDGHFTKDSDVASDLYDFLTSRGLKVFNSRRVVLPVGKSYEPYIISALLSAKAMIVVGSSADNMNAQWVKDEWSRFQWLQKREKKERGTTDRRLLCYLTGSMRPEQIPRSLGTGRQAIVDGVRAHEQLSALLDELLGKKSSAGAAADYSGKAVAEDSYRKVLGQMTAWLYTGKYDKVLDRYDSLNESGKYLENAQLHLLALCAANHVEDVRKLAASEINLSQERLFKLALKLSAGEEREELKSILDENQKYLKHAAEGSQKDPGQGKKKEEKKSRSKWDELKNRPKKPAEPEKSTEEPAKTEGKSGSKWTAVKPGEKSAPERAGETTGAKSVPERAGETTGAKSTSEKNEEKTGEKPKTEKTEETREAEKKPVKPAKEAADQKKGPRTVDEPGEVPRTSDDPDEMPRTVDEPDEVPRTGNGGGTAGPGEDEPKQPFWIYGAIAAVVILICVLGLIFGPGRSSQSSKKAEDESGTAMENAAATYEQKSFDQKEADKVAELIDAIYVQSWTEDTEEQCAEAKDAWDALTDEQKKLVNGVYANPDYFGKDTGDASLDDPLNQDDIEEKELLVVSFGTSFNESRYLDIGGIEKALQKKFPDWSVRRAFTSQIVINHVLARDGEKIDNVEQALQRAADNGVKVLVIQPTLLLHGAEYDELEMTVSQYADRFKHVAIAEPLLGEISSEENSINAEEAEITMGLMETALEGAGYFDVDEAVSHDTAFVFVGHGTSHTAKVAYTQMQLLFIDHAMDWGWIGTVDGEPEGTECEEIFAKIAEKGFKRVVLRPLMVTAGETAYNGIAGDGANSWKSKAEEYPLEIIDFQMEGMGRTDFAQSIYVEHTKVAINQLFDFGLEEEQQQ